MNFFKTFNFDKHKIKKKIENEINCIMKIKRPFMKVMLWNEVVKHYLFKSNFDIENLFDSF
jgi:hypothetical protein